MARNYSKSKQLFKRAEKSIPGGVNSPVRAFGSVGGTPVFMERAKGAYMYDVDGNKYVDYINSWGATVLGHGFAPVVTAIKKQATLATSFGTPTELEIKMAEMVKTMAPNVDLIRMVSSGTEACMSALRLARGYTGRHKFIKFEGCYHGHADAFLTKAGSGVATAGIQAVPGITKSVAMDALTAAYNDLEAVQKLAGKNKGAIAAIIVEPVAGNMGCVAPRPGFLQGLRSICDKQGIVLIFDEVMTGFRLAPGGAQQRLGIKADLVTYGKIIGGGLPVGAFGGRRKIMEHIAPLGNVYQAGTLSGNPITMAAGYAALKTLKENPSIYKQLDEKTQYLHKGLDKALSGCGKPYTINRFGSMISLHFGHKPVTDFASAAAADKTLFGKFFHSMLGSGIYLPPSPFETWFVSAALSKQDIDKTLKAAKKIRF